MTIEAAPTPDDLEFVTQVSTWVFTVGGNLFVGVRYQLLDESYTTIYSMSRDGAAALMEELHAACMKADEVKGGDPGKNSTEPQT